jgi:hypothetical protein
MTASFIFFPNKIISVGQRRDETYRLLSRFYATKWEWSSTISGLSIPLASLWAALPQINFPGVNLLSTPLPLQENQRLELF